MQKCICSSFFFVASQGNYLKSIIYTKYYIKHLLIANMQSAEMHLFKNNFFPMFSVALQENYQNSIYFFSNYITRLPIIYCVILSYIAEFSTLIPVFISDM